MQLSLPFTWTEIFLSLAGGSFAVFANMIYFVMIGKVNERLPEGERISYLWWGTEVRKKFKQLYPGSKLIFFLDLCVAIVAVCFCILIWVIG